MSLQVWLPLNGDLHNQGLKSNNLTSANYEINNNGKIGQCIKTKTTGSIDLQYNGNIINTSSLSFGGWFKFNQSDINTKLSTYTYDSTRSTPTGNLIGNNSYGGISLQWYTNNIYTSGSFSHLYVQSCLRTSSNGSQSTSAFNIPFDTWIHIMLVFNKITLKCYLYIDGVQKYEFTNTNFSDAPSRNMYLNGNYVAGGNGPTFNIPFYCNDVRIYDHALSPKEVEEIAKGLVLHYKLDEPIQLSENLMPNHLVMALGTANSSTGTWRTAGSTTMSKSRVLITDSPEGECYGFQNQGVQTPNDGSCYGIDSFPLQGNTTYTISMWARIINGTEGYAGYNIYNISTEKGGSHSKIDKNYRVTTLPSDGSWIKCWYTFTTNASNARNIYIGITTGDTDVTTQMCCVHIEKIDKTIMQIYDSSGYSNNGTISGTLTAAAGSPRYGTTTQFNGSSLIEADPLPTETLTISAWVNFADTSGSAYRIVVHDKNTGLAIGYYSSKIITYVGSSNGGTGSCVTANLTANTWYHIVVVKTGATTRDTYINGVKATTTSNNYWGGDLVKFHIGGRHISGNYSGYTTGKIVDVRAYTTALTADQIKELYNTSMSIDSNGNVYARELVEL